MTSWTIRLALEFGVWRPSGGDSVINILGEVEWMK